MRSWLQAADISFLQRVAGLSSYCHVHRVNLFNDSDKEMGKGKYILSWVKLFTVASTYPVDEKGLDEFDDLQCYQETDGYKVVEQDNESEEVEAKVSSPAIYQDKFWTKGSDT